MWVMINISILKGIIEVPNIRRDEQGGDGGEYGDRERREKVRMRGAAKSQLFHLFGNFDYWLFIVQEMKEMHIKLDKIMQAVGVTNYTDL